MRDDDDILRECKNLYGKGNMLVRNFHMCSENVKILLFKTFCSSFYTCQLWWNYPKAIIHKLKVAYNNIFRMLFKLPRDSSASSMLANRYVNSCPGIIRKLIYGFRSRVEQNDNQILSSMLTADMRWWSRIRLHWASLLFTSDGTRTLF